MESCAESNLRKYLFKVSIRIFPTDFQCFLKICILINVDVTYSFGVTKYWDVAALLLYGSDELSRSSRDHQINVLVHCQQVAYLLSCRHLRKREECTLFLLPFRDVLFIYEKDSIKTNRWQIDLTWKRDKRGVVRIDITSER